MSDVAPKWRVALVWGPPLDAVAESWIRRFGYRRRQIRTELLSSVKLRHMLNFKESDLSFRRYLLSSVFSEASRDASREASQDTSREASGDTSREAS